jgi:predicted enzyme related to lactoylglutathione lyase
MKIKMTSVYVDDQDKALRFYTEVLGFAKKADFCQGPYRWLTVGSPEEPDGAQLQLALNNNRAAKAYQQAIFQQGQPAAMFFTDDVKGDYERIKARGAEFTIPAPPLAPRVYRHGCEATGTVKVQITVQNLGVELLQGFGVLCRDMPVADQLADQAGHLRSAKSRYLLRVGANQAALYLAQTPILLPRQRALDLTCPRDFYQTELRSSP